MPGARVDSPRYDALQAGRRSEGCPRSGRSNRRRVPPPALRATDAQPDATNGVCSHDDIAPVKRPSARTDKTPSRIVPSSGTGDDLRLPPTSAPRSRRRRGLARLPLLVLIPMLVGILGGPTAPVGADELSDARARQNALAQQLRDQKAQVAKINALQSDLSDQIASTRRQLGGINADLATVKHQIGTMIVKIGVVRQHYLGLVSQLQLLDTQLDRVKQTEMRAGWHLAERKYILAERLRQAYDTNRTSMLETFLSAGS